MPDDNKFRLPLHDEHTTIVGRTGSGKTQLGGWLLSKQHLKTKPWYVLDYKGDKLLNSITRAREIDTNETPSQPGLYILHSRPDLEDETERWLWQLWANEGAGLYIDEGYMLPGVSGSTKGAFHALLTQGRSKQIPVVTLSQRPVRVPRVAISEASHVIFFDLSDNRDRKTLAENVPSGFMNVVPDDVEGKQDPYDPEQILLPKYHARWWNVPDRRGDVLRPVPEAKQIVADIDAMLEPKRTWF